MPIKLLYARIFCFVYCSRTTDYKSITLPQNKPGGSYKPIPPPKPKNYRPPQANLSQPENNGNETNNTHQHSKSYSIATSHVENTNNVQRNSGQYYYNIPPPNRHDSNLGNSHHNLNHLSTSAHNHSLSHTHAHCSPPMSTHSHSNSASQLSLGLSHNRNNVNHNGYVVNNGHNAPGQSFPTSPGHNREPSGLDLAGSREQRGSAFELYRKPVHHYNARLEVPNKTIVKRRTNRKTKSKGNIPKRRSARQKQRKNVSETDSDLEIVFVEDNPNSSENDLFIVENNTNENSHCTEDENYEINIKILWQSKDVHRLNICRNENFRKIFEYFANLEKVPIDEILITKRDKTIKKNDTPASINLSVIDILEGGIIKKDNIEHSKNIDEENNEDVCVIKIQTTNKKSLTVSINRDENFEFLLEKCAQELNVEKQKIKLYFDGELVTITDTPDSLEIEDIACFDLRLSS